MKQTPYKQKNILKQHVIYNEELQVEELYNRCDSFFTSPEFIKFDYQE